MERLPARDFNSFAWPRDEAELKGLVEIDFSTDLSSVVSQSPATFDAIRPSGGTAVFELAPIFESFIARMKRARAGIH